MLRNFLILLLGTSLFFSCGNNESENSYDLIPYPNSMKENKGQFNITDETKLILPVNTGEDIRQIAVQFTEDLHKASGFIIAQEVSNSGSANKNTINFILNGNLQKEAYVLTVDHHKIMIEAAAAPGFFYAIQSLKQLMPVQIYGDYVAAKNTKWAVPCVVIDDAPRFGYRGLLLDVARYFFDAEEVKKVIDIMAVHKLNTLHWHLTDDQGWRIEIKKYPELTEIGSVRRHTMIRKEWGNFDTIPRGGFYTQEQIREVVKYAADRQITVIPEVDLPGHMISAMATYPELGCTGGPYEVLGEWGVMNDVLCVGKESTFTFLENVYLEVMDLFPSEYINIGGDECPKIRWEKCPHCQAKIKELGLVSDDKYKAEHYLQSYTMKRMEKFLNDHGRKIIGWDEILEGGASSTATVMSWRGFEGGLEAVRKGNDVIMAPKSYCYIDYYQSLETDKEPFGIGGYVPMEKVYSLEPIPDELTEEESKHIIGPQANLWAEYISTNDHLEYMLLPRLAAMSEVQWTQPALKNWDRFLASLVHITKIYDTMHFNYAKHVFEATGRYTVNADKQCVEAELFTQDKAPVYYTLDGSEPTSESILYSGPVEIRESCTLKARAERNDMETRTLEKSFGFNKATGKKLILNTQPKEKYTYRGATVLNDGLRGWFDYATGYWLGYEDEPLDVTIEFPELTEVSSVKIGALILMIEWILPPERITVLGSVDGENYIRLCEKEIPILQTEKDGLKEYGCTFTPSKVRRLRVKVDNVMNIPTWHRAKGNKAFVFVDEIMVD